jgi:Kef-type K+ transport system membrane component KefB
MPDINFMTPELMWPLAIALTWLAGEFLYRWTGLPRISSYGLCGFALANVQWGILTLPDNSSILLMANVAFGLILFEFGYRINLRWLRTNPWIGMTGVLESGLTFIVVFAIAQWYGSANFTALLLAALAMSTSPAGILRVINEQRSAGQVTERVLHLTAINCVLAVFTFKVVVAFWIFQSSGSILQAITGSLQVLVLSALLGAAFGILLPLVLRELGSLARDATIAFAFAVIALVALTHVAKLSPILATLSFGLMARHRRVTLNQAQRNFGALGDMLTVMLFLCGINTGMVARLGRCRSGYSAGLRPPADKSRRQYGVCPRQRNHLSQRSADGSGAVTHFGFCHSDAGTNTLSGYRFGR